MESELDPTMSESKSLDDTPQSNPQATPGNISRGKPPNVSRNIYRNQQRSATFDGTSLGPGDSNQTASTYKNIQAQQKKRNSFDQGFRQLVPDSRRSTFETGLIFDKTRLCDEIRQHDTCGRMDRCRHAHHISEVRSTAHVFRTRLCVKATCHAKFMCRAAHVNKELTLVECMVKVGLLPVHLGCIKHTDYLRLLRDLGSIDKSSDFGYMKIVEELRDMYDIRSPDFDDPEVYEKFIAELRADDASWANTPALNHRGVLLTILADFDEEEETAYRDRGRLARRDYFDRDERVHQGWTKYGDF